jgi:hypothetical protein
MFDVGVYNRPIVIHGERRNRALNESPRSKHRSYFQVAAASVQMGPGLVFGRILNFFVYCLPEERLEVFVHVQIFELVDTSIMRPPVWTHDYKLINHNNSREHFFPAQLLGPCVVVVPHPQGPLRDLGLYLVLENKFLEGEFD